MAIACGLALVAVAIIIVLRLRPGFSRTSGRGGGNLSSIGGPGNRNMGNHYLSTQAHLPLSQNSCGARNGECIDECIDMEEKDPDVIPSNKGTPLKYQYLINYKLFVALVKLEFQ